MIDQEFESLIPFVASRAELYEVATLTQHTIQEFQKVSFPAGFGFDPFEISDITRYLSADAHYNLSLKKVKGQGILYGTVHAELRRQFFNQLPRQMRLQVILPKLKYFSLDTYLSDYFGMRTTVPIYNVEDIGMGHSVYRLSTAHGDVVLKQESVPNQQFYMEFQRALGYPWFRSQHFIGNRNWELTEYLGPLNLNDALVQGSINFWDPLINQLAQHAAMGDVLGREDRHFENYVVRGNSILPVDTSMLFGDGNEQWSERYIAGGLYEICVLSQFIKQPGEFDARLAQFESVYDAQFRQLVASHESVLRLISEFYGEEDGASHRKTYVQSRLMNLEYPQHQFLRYRAGFEQMMERSKIKTAIQTVGLNDPFVLEKFPILKMYYLADQGRVSTLFLMEYHQSRVIAALDELGIKFP